MNIKMDDALIYLVNLPGSIKGVSTVNSNGEPIVFINCNLCDEQVEITKRHELEHLNRNHFWSNMELGRLEKEASGI